MSARFAVLSTLGLALAGAACRDEHAPAPPAVTATDASAADGSAPEEYLQLHLTLLSPQDPAWHAAVKRLRAVGDAFTLAELVLVDAYVSGIDAEQRRLVDELRTAVRARTPRDTAETLPPLVLGRLERAALADLLCHALEGSLVRWTLASIREHADDARVRAELERIRDHYVPSTEIGPALERAPVRVELATLSGRVRRYATELLAPGDTVAAQER